jgi:hypothetical protein
LNLGRHNLILNQGQPYSIREQIESRIKENVDCQKDSLLIFLTNIACTEYDLYPDMKDLFVGPGLQQTQALLSRNKMHAVAVWFSVSFFDFMFRFLKVAKELHYFC